MGWWRFGRSAVDVRELEATAERLAALPTSRWREFDEQVRERTIHAPLSIEVWWDLEAADVVPIGRRCARPAAAWAVLAMHRSGYVREAAVRALAEVEDDVALLALVLRLADWVEAVRAAARVAIEPLVARAEPESWVRTLGLTDALILRKRGAAEIGELRLRVVSRVSTPTLVGALGSPDRPLRRAVARALSARSGNELTAALSPALEQDDPATARIVVTALQERAATDSTLLEQMLASRWAPVRRIALEGLAARGGPRADVLLREHLMDAASIVRWVAQHHSKRCSYDVEAHYRARLATTPAVALRGLAEVGALRSMPDIEPYLVSSSRRARATAVKELTRLGGRDVDVRVATFLADESPRVALAAARALSHATPSPAALEESWRIAERGVPAGARKPVFLFFHSLGRWAQLRMAARAVVSDDSDLSERGRRLLDFALATWNRSFSPPDTSATDELRRLIPGLRPRVPDLVARTLDASVKAFLGI